MDTILGDEVCLELGAGDLSERHKLNELKGDVQFEFR
jgi:hypothetical protein